MKLHFEANLDYQHAAIEAVCDLFRGQEICRTEFTVIRSASGKPYFPGFPNDLGIGNLLACKIYSNGATQFTHWDPLRNASDEMVF